MKKLFGIVLSLALFLAIFPVAAGAEATSVYPTTPTETVTSNSPDELTNSDLLEDDGTVEVLGFKRWFAEKAVKGIANALRAGANNKWVKKAITEYFDAPTAKVFKKNLDEIADVLDEAVRISELSSDYIKDAIYDLMYKTTKNHGISLSIADGVTALIDIFVL